jgi:hypothetical protein
VGGRKIEREKRFTIAKRGKKKSEWEDFVLQVGGLLRHERPRRGTWNLTTYNRAPTFFQCKNSR